LDDLIVGADYADPSGKSGAGKSYVVFGNKIKSSKPSPLTSPALETEGPKEPLSSLIVSLLIRKPPIPEAIADKLMAVPSGADYADPSGKSGAGKSYVVFGNSNAINLSVIADASNPIGGFVINGGSENDIQAIAVDITCRRD
jgi:hypothetical protein